MPNVPVRRVAILLAMAKSQELGQEVAIFFNQEGVIKAAGVGDSVPPYDPPGPIINMLQNEHAMANIGRPGKTEFIATSARPSEKTLGMLVLVQGNAVPVLYFDPAPPGGGAPGIFVYSLSLTRGPNFKTWTSRPEHVAPFLTQNANYNFDQAQCTAIDRLIANPTKLGAFNWFNSFEHNLHALDRQIGKNIWTSPQTLLGTLTRANLLAAPRVPAAPFTADQLSRLSRRRITFPAFTLPLAGPGVTPMVPGPGRADTPVRHNIFMRLSWAVLQAGDFWRRQPDPGNANRNGHNIGGVLRGPHDEIVAWGLNTNTGDFSQHGEVNLLEYFYQPAAVRPNPLNAHILYTTLEPCHMCSGMYADVGHNMACRYGQADDTSENSALRRQANGSSEIWQATPMSARVGAEFEMFKRQNGGRANITAYLNGPETAAILQFAFDSYVDLRTNLIDGDRTVWENGLRLLHHIDPNVNARWQARHDHFYPGVIP